MGFTGGSGVPLAMHLHLLDALLSEFRKIRIAIARDLLNSYFGLINAPASRLNTWSASLIFLGFGRNGRNIFLDRATL